MNLWLKGLIIIAALCVLSACALRPTQVPEKTNGQVLVLLAHPDDETWISGTLARWADQGQSLQLVYVTSGDAGKDRSGQGLSGAELAVVREQEARKALDILGIERATIFMRWPDGSVSQRQDELSGEIEALLTGYDRLVSFGADGVTGHPDHIAVANAVHQAWQSLKRPMPLYQAAVSSKRAGIAQQIANDMGIPYKIPQPIADEKVTEVIDVSAQGDKRTAAFQAHKTQFPAPIQQLWQRFVEASGAEEFVVLD
tara:strand:+ start:104 stop:871 length:768 start_codon:yes stop_codon:yes gene_type:complete